MSIQVSELQTLIKPIQGSNQTNKQEAGIQFEDVFNQAMSFLDETNNFQKQADKATLDYAAGKTDNIHEVMIAQDKALTTLQLTVEIRDQLLEAYREIMRIQV